MVVNGKHTCIRVSRSIFQSPFSFPLELRNIFIVYFTMNETEIFEIKLKCKILLSRYQTNARVCLWDGHKWKLFMCCKFYEFLIFGSVPTNFQFHRYLLINSDKRYLISLNLRCVHSSLVTQPRINQNCTRFSFNTYVCCFDRSRFGNLMYQRDRVW